VELNDYSTVDRTPKRRGLFRSEQAPAQSSHPRSDRYFLTTFESTSSLDSFLVQKNQS
jgi:hypothetical protein